MHRMHFVYHYQLLALLLEHYQLFAVKPRYLFPFFTSNPYVKDRSPCVCFCYLFATNGVFCYQFPLIFIKCNIAYNPQKIKEYLIKLKSVKQNKNGLLIRMSLVRVQLPEPQISADFCGFFIVCLLPRFYAKLDENGSKLP